MAFPDELLQLAAFLSEDAAVPLTQASLRRAISTAYYARSIRDEEIAQEFLVSLLIKPRD